MTLESRIGENRYLGNGVTNAFPFTFKIWKRDQISVHVGNGMTERMVTPARVDITATGGTAYLMQTPAAGETVVLRRSMPYVQEDDYRNGSKFDAEEIEDRLDQDCAERQDLKLDVGRAIKLPVTSSKTSQEWWEDLLAVAGSIQSAKDLIYSWLQSIGTDHEGNSAVVMAEGGSAWRALSDKLGDIVSVKDFGAKGDGETNDTAAFQVAAASGRTVFVPQGTYNVTQAVEGCFVTLEGCSVPNVRVKNLSIDLVPFSAWAKCPKSLGMDMVGAGLNELLSVDTYEDHQWSGASQHGCCDLWDSVLYIPGDGGGDTTRITVVKWSEKENERVLLARSGNTTGIVPHQSLAIYRPSKKDNPLFAGFSGYAYGTFYTNLYGLLQIFSYNYKTDPVPTLVKTLEVFSADDGFNNETACNAAISPDGSVLVCSGTNNNDKIVIRVYDCHAVMQGQITNLKTQYKNQIILDGGGPAGQGIATDGTYVYMLADSSVRPETNLTDILITPIPVNAENSCKEITLSVFDKSAPIQTMFSDYKVFPEFESLLFCPVGGKIVPIFLTDYKYYNIIDSPSSYRQYMIYADGSAQNSNLDVSARYAVVHGDIYQRCNAAKTDAPCLMLERPLVKLAPLENDMVPVVGGTHATVIGAGECNETARQAYIEAREHDGVGSENVNIIADNAVLFTAGCGSYNKNNIPIYNIKNKADGTTNEWNGLCLNSENRCFLKNAIPFFALSLGDVSVGTQTSSDKHGYFVFAGSSLTANNANIIGLFGCTTHSSGATSLNFSLRDYTNVNSEMSDVLSLFYDKTNSLYKVEAGGRIIPAVDNAYGLGDGGRRFTAVYAADGSINTSDERLKKYINKIDDEVLDAVESIDFKAFKFISAIEKKGAENARIHTGAIAQEIKRAFEAKGIDPYAFGFFCWDAWGDEYKTFEIEDQAEVVDDAGRIVQRRIAHTEERKISEAGDMYSLRYEELLCLEAACQRRRAEKLEARIAEMQEQINSLVAMVEQLTVQTNN